jgi:AcrR family transcriptional regulator
MTAATDRKIKEGFLRVLAHKHLEEMTIVEVVAEAKISRSTFYLNYNGLASIYEALVADLLAQTSAIDSQIDCASCKETGTPFCELVRESGKYAPIIKEGRFLPTVLQLIEPAQSGNLMHESMERGLDYKQAYALHVFQMSGCFAASIMPDANDEDWPRIKQAIDAFIRAGISAISPETR